MKVEPTTDEEPSSAYGLTVFKKMQSQVKIVNKC